MKPSVETTMVMFFMLYFILNDVVKINGENVRDCVENIREHFNTERHDICFYNMCFAVINKPDIPSISNIPQGIRYDVDILLRDFPACIKYAYYLGERVQVGKILNPTKFCRTIYFNGNVTGIVLSNGDIVYEDDENRHIIILTDDDNPDDLFFDNPNDTVRALRNAQLNNAGLSDTMNQKQLFDALYRMDVTNLDKYAIHAFNSAEIMNGTLDAEPFCMKPSIKDALNSGIDNTLFENVSYYNEGQASGSNSQPAKRERNSSPPLLSLFPQ